MQSMNLAGNPLSGHFRQPSIFVKLPSSGRYWAPQSLNLPANGEVGVMPMTAKDEIMLRTPDALMNGQGIVSVIQSCCPSITNAWGMPTVDVDTLLIAIRIATYGDKMDMDSDCPNCKHDNRHQLELGPVLMKVRSPDYDKTVEVDGLTIKFKPTNYLQSTKNNIASFEEQKIIQLLNNEDIDADTRKAQFDVHLNKIIDSNINILSMSTESITTENGEVVTDRAFISEFYTNTSNRNIKAVQAKLKDISETAGLPPARVQCEECSTEYNVAVTFDYANFFEPLS